MNTTKRWILAGLVIVAVSGLSWYGYELVSPDPPFGFLESPAAQVTVQGPDVEITGWVLDDADPAASVELLLDGQVVRLTPSREARLDVCAAYSSGVIVKSGV